MRTDERAQARIAAEKGDPQCGCRVYGDPRLETRRRDSSGLTTLNEKLFQIVTSFERLAEPSRL
jgi:hypothetical protein